MSEIDEEIDDFYDDKFKNEHNLELFSYIDWGFNTDHDMLDSDVNFLDTDPFTADMLRDPTTESVYLDMIQYGYAKEMRDFPEEIIDWTVSDYYTEVVDKGELSDIPNSTEESELYSIDSSNSVSDFYLGSDEDSDLGAETIHISEEMSTDFNDFDLQNGEESKQKKFEIFNDILKIQELDANVKPITGNGVDMFGSQTNAISRLRSNFDDNQQNYIFESSELLSSENIEWGDYTQLELEENTRELESFFRQSKYVDAFRLESLFDEILVSKNLEKENGELSNGNESFTKKRNYGFKYFLFLKTRYLKHYRGIMLDLNWENYMF